MTGAFAAARGVVRCLLFAPVCFLSCRISLCLHCVVHRFSHGSGRSFVCSVRLPCGTNRAFSFSALWWNCSNFWLCSLRLSLAYVYIGFVFLVVCASVPDGSSLGVVLLRACCLFALALAPAAYYRGAVALSCSCLELQTIHTYIRGNGNIPGL